ncbi:MAG: efflux RND transporter periplasmic adaptor subunit, partial [Gammaproteobacteria bacterium]|nr:efflux RND transporter periplasmic adaptor subunit [Gammaproteobacteria bacterium]
MTYISLKNSFIVTLLIASTFVGSVSVTAETPPTPVKVEQVKPLEQSSTTDILGTINSRNQAQLTAGVTGRLEWVAEPGTYLEKGDLVAQIELLPLQLRKAEQEAQHKRAKINLQYLERELTRQKELQKKNSVSQNQY